LAGLVRSTIRQQVPDQLTDPIGFGFLIFTRCLGIIVIVGEY